jgi:uncharacterized protein
MRAFVDTSGLFAALVANDDHHKQAHEVLSHLLDNDCRLVTTSAVLLETVALLQARAGFAAARAFQRDFLPRLEVHWMTEALFETGAKKWLTRGSRRLSLVDCISFALMEEQELTDAFTFDRHFSDEGFRQVST